MHIVYVDMSAKAEHWTLSSAVAMADDLNWVCLVSGKVKQRARKLLAERFGLKNLRYRLFAAMIYLTLQGRLAAIEQIVIDKDYHGEQAEATIKNLLLAHIRKELPEARAGLIRFANIKGTDADHLAKQVYDGKTKADRVVRYRVSCGHRKKLGKSTRDISATRSGNACYPQGVLWPVTTQLVTYTIAQHVKCCDGAWPCRTRNP